VLCQLSYAPGSSTECSLALLQRRALALLFTVLAFGLAAVGVLSALAGGRAWIVAVASLALALWLGDLARRTLG
jgi:hypothetical protein